MVFTNEPVESEESVYEFDQEVSTIEMYWVSDHYNEIVEKYGGEWIAVVNDEVIAHALKLSDVRAVLDERNLQLVFVEKIPTKDQASGFVVA